MAVNKLQFIFDFVTGKNKPKEDLKKTEKQAKKTNKSIKKIGRSLKALGSGTRSLLGGLVSLKGAAVGFAAAFAGAKVISLANEQEDAINSLNVALKTAGSFSEAASRDMQKFASSLQQTTKFGDETILKAQGLLVSLSGLSGEGLKTATKAALDMSSALGVSLESAMTLVGKAAVGEIGSLSRYGIIVKRGSDNADTFQKVLTTLNTKFGGAAAGQLKTFSGATQQAANSFGDLLEEIGFLITKNPLVISAVNQFQTIFTEMGASINTNRDSIIKFVNTGLISLIKGLAEVSGAVGPFATAMEISFDVVKIAARTMALGVITPLALIEKGINAFTNSSSLIPERFRTDFTAAQELMAEFSESIVQDMDDIKTSFDAPFNTEAVEARLTSLAESLEAESKIRKKAAAKDIKTTTKKVKKLSALERSLTDTSTKGLTDMFSFEKGVSKDRSANLKSTLGTMASLQSSGNKTLFAIGKASGIATATVDGIVAVQKALASGLFPLNIAFAAIIGTATALNIAKIAGSKPPGMNHGGILGGNNSIGDQTLFNGNAGEAVLTQGQQKEFINLANGDGGESSAIQQLAEAIQQQPTVVEIDGFELARALKVQNELGFVS